MIALFTDFGSADLYVGQVKAILAQSAPGIPVVDLLHDVPAFNVRAGAHLLAALAQAFPVGSVFLAVVDPGVGGPRRAAVLEAEGRYFVGPDNGLLSVLAERASHRCWHIDWQPQRLSRTFHGRDLFAPLVAQLANGQFPQDGLSVVPRLDISLGAADAAEIIYLDHYGNAMTGLRADSLDHAATLELNGHALRYARTFSDVTEGTAFWYENSLGLIEIAVNCDSAAERLGLVVGQRVQCR